MPDLSSQGLTLESQTGSNPGDRIIYSCPTNYLLELSKQRKAYLSCGSDNIWGTTSENCLETCLTAPLPSTDSTYSYDGSSAIFVGDAITYNCDTGFEFSDGSTSKSVTCLTGDTWQAADLVCVTTGKRDLNRNPRAQNPQILYFLNIYFSQLWKSAGSQRTGSGAILPNGRRGW